MATLGVTTQAAAVRPVAGAGGQPDRAAVLRQLQTLLVQMQSSLGAPANGVGSAAAGGGVAAAAGGGVAVAAGGGVPDTLGLPTGPGVFFIDPSRSYALSTGPIAPVPTTAPVTDAVAGAMSSAGGPVQQPADAPARSPMQIPSQAPLQSPVQAPQSTAPGGPQPDSAQPTVAKGPADVQNPAANGAGAAPTVADLEAIVDQRIQRLRQLETTSDINVLRARDPQNPTVQAIDNEHEVIRTLTDTLVRIRPIEGQLTGADAPLLDQARRGDAVAAFAQLLANARTRSGNVTVGGGQALMAMATTLANRSRAIGGDGLDTPNRPGQGASATIAGTAARGGGASFAPEVLAAPSDPHQAALATFVHVARRMFAVSDQALSMTDANAKRIVTATAGRTDAQLSRVVESATGMDASLID